MVVQRRGAAVQGDVVGASVSPSPAGFAVDLSPTGRGRFFVSPLWGETAPEARVRGRLYLPWRRSLPGVAPVGLSFSIVTSPLTSTHL